MRCIELVTVHHDQDLQLAFLTPGAAVVQVWLTCRLKKCELGGYGATVTRLTQFGKRCVVIFNHGDKG